MSNQLPKISSYGKYSSDNYGAHTLQVRVGSLTIWFSYQTMVAFRGEDTGLIVISNYWGPTTGKHLNWIDGGGKDVLKRRLTSEQFEAKWIEYQNRTTSEVLA